MSYFDSEASIMRSLWPTWGGVATFGGRGSGNWNVADNFDGVWKGDVKYYTLWRGGGIKGFRTFFGKIMNYNYRFSHLP